MENNYQIKWISFLSTTKSLPEALLIVYQLNCYEKKSTHTKIKNFENYQFLYGLCKFCKFIEGLIVIDQGSTFYLLGMKCKDVLRKKVLWISQNLNFQSDVAAKGSCCIQGADSVLKYDHLISIMIVPIRISHKLDIKSRPWCAGTPLSLSKCVCLFVEQKKNATKVAVFHCQPS